MGRARVRRSLGWWDGEGKELSGSDTVSYLCGALRGGRCVCGMCPCACPCVCHQQMVLTCCGGKHSSGPARTRQGAATDHLQLFSTAAVGVKSAAVITGPESTNQNTTSTAKQVFTSAGHLFRILTILSKPVHRGRLIHSRPPVHRASGEPQSMGPEHHNPIIPEP